MAQANHISVHAELWNGVRVVVLSWASPDGADEQMFSRFQFAAQHGHGGAVGEQQIAVGGVSTVSPRRGEDARQ